MNNGKICVSVCSAGVEEMIANIRRAEEFADVIEVRFDCLATDDVWELLGKLPATEKTYLFTYRPKEQGGMSELPLGERLKFWERAFQLNKSGFMIDIECDPSMLSAVNPDKIERIVSQHYFTVGSDNHQMAWNAISALSGGPIKIAVMADDVVDTIGVWNLLTQAKKDNRKLIPIAMGEAGKWTRILGLAHGAAMTYAALDAGGETAPGQITAKNLIEVYRVKDLDQITRVYGVIGDPVSQSLSPFIHNPAFASGGINAVFLPFQVKDIGAFMRRMVREESREVELNFVGFSVTMPHKQSIMKFLDAIDPVAKAIGAVNTVKIDDGKLTGYNTDAHGFITPLKEKYGDLTGARVAVFGAGGAARACVYALKQENAEVTVLARDVQKARRFGDEFEVAAHRISEIAPGPFDIVVNTTPLGMSAADEESPLLTARQLDGVRFVYDLVTKPSDTPLIREAKKAGIRSIGGVEMLIAQGARQYEIWTEIAAPLRVMHESVVARIGEQKR